MESTVRVYVFGLLGDYVKSMEYISEFSPSEREMLTEQIKLKFQKHLKGNFVYKAVDNYTGEKQIRLVEYGRNKKY